MKTIAWKKASNVFVLVHGEQDPVVEEWDTFIADLVLQIGERRGLVLSLVVTPGSGPNMRQRKQLSDALKSVQSRSAVVTGSAIARTVVSILRLRNPEVRAFDPGQLEHALTHLDVDSAEKSKVRRVVDELRNQLGLAPMQ